MIRRAKKVAKSAYLAMFSPVFKEAERCLEYLAEGEINRSIEVLERSGQFTRRAALMRSVNGGFQYSRAPCRQQQVDFFRRAYELTQLGSKDQMKLFVALAYNAAEVGSIEVLEQTAAELENRVEFAERQRSVIPIALRSKKRGHHFFYSIMNVLGHVHLSMGNSEAFDLLIDRTCTFFHERTAPTRDKGFGWASVNAIDLLGLARIRAVVHADTQRQKRLTQTMYAMLRLGVERKVGPIEWPGFYHSCARCQRAISLETSTGQAELRQVFDYLVRVRTDVAQDRIFRALSSRVEADQPPQRSKAINAPAAQDERTKINELS